MATNTHIYDFPLLLHISLLLSSYSRKPGILPRHCLKELLPVWKRNLSPWSPSPCFLRAKEDVYVHHVWLRTQGLLLPLLQDFSTRLWLWQSQPGKETKHDFHNGCLKQNSFLFFWFLFVRRKFQCQHKNSSEMFRDFHVWTYSLKNTWVSSFPVLLKF